MWHRIVLMTFAATALTGLCGCRVVENLTAQRVDAPTSRAESVSVVERTAEGVRLLITVVLENPNDVPLPLVDASYRVGFTGGPTIAFDSDPNKTIPAQSRQLVELPAALPLESGADPESAEVSVSGSVTYKPPGEIRALLTESGIPLPNVHFRYAGPLGAAGRAASAAP